MEPETGAAAKGKDTDDDQKNPDTSSLTGKKEDQRQQILMDTEDTNWYKNTQALKYLQPVFMPIVKDKMKSLQLQCETDFGRQLCAEATADDIILVNGSLAKFKHLCPGTVVACQTLLNIIKEHTSDSVNFYQMLKGTDPQNWLKSPFEFVRLFLKDWMRCDIHDFQKCDITALCTIVKRCKPLMQIFDERKIDDLRKVRNRTMHPATMSISQQEMENNIDVILDFLEHIKSLKSTDEVNEAIESIKQLKTGDVRLLHSMVVRLIQGWLPGARIVYEHKCDQAKNQLQDIIYMEKLLSRLSSGQEITTIKQSAEHEFVAKTERLTDESQKLKLTTEELAKEKEERRELEKQLEELRELRQEEKRELEKQSEELRKLRQKEKREAEEQIKKLEERLETNERRSFGKVSRPKEIYIQKSPDDPHEDEILMDTGNMNWYKSTQALNYLQPVFMSIVKDNMKSLQLHAMTDFGRQLCAEATADDIIRVNGSLAQFKHLCSGTLVPCQNLLNIIKGHTSDSVNFYQMLKGTDPQQWLKSPFEFVRLFLKDWMRCHIHDFQECDIMPLCTIVKRCKPLMQIFDVRKIDELRKLRNRTMHPATMSISQQEMENNIDVIIDFLEHIKSLKSTDEVTKAIEIIKQLRTGDVRLLHSMRVRLIEGWISCARRAYEHSQAKYQLQDIIYMENKLARLSSGQDISPIKQIAEHECGAKIEKPTDESQKIIQMTEELAKEKEVKRKLETQNEELRKRLETIERRSFGEVCRPKEMSTQRSPDDALETEELSKPEPPYDLMSKSLSDLERLGDEHETLKEELSKPKPPSDSPKMTLSD